MTQRVTEKQRKNLVPLATRSPAERKAICQKGAAGATAAKRKKKMVKELAEAMMDSAITESEAKALHMLFPNISQEDCVNKALLVGSLKREALKGNVKAVELLLSIIGELPAKEVSGSIITQKVFISQEQQDATLKHIAQVINDGTDDNGK